MDKLVNACLNAALGKRVKGSVSAISDYSMFIATSRQDYCQFRDGPPGPVRPPKPARKARVNAIKAPHGQQNARKFKTGRSGTCPT
jgi:hypothetical protein